LPASMTARFAKRVLSIEPSATVRISDLITDLKARGEKILSLAIGEPDFPTPAHIIDAAKRALDDGFTKYTPASGIRELREAIADLVKDHDLILVSDEIYEKILYEGEHVSPASLDGMFDRTVTVHGFSKTYSMTGWRLGWLVAPSPLFKEISKVQEHTITCATAFAQKAGVAALRGPTAPLQAMVKEFRARRDLVLKELATVEGL